VHPRNKILATPMVGVAYHCPEQHQHHTDGATISAITELLLKVVFCRQHPEMIVI